MEALRGMTPKELRLVFRKTFEFLKALSVLVVADVFYEHVTGKDTETLHNPLLHT